MNRQIPICYIEWKLLSFWICYFTSNILENMDLLNRALEQVIDQLVTQKVALLKLEIENQKKTIFGKFFQSFKF